MTGSLDRREALIREGFQRSSAMRRRSEHDQAIRRMLEIIYGLLLNQHLGDRERLIAEYSGLLRSIPKRIKRDD